MNRIRMAALGAALVLGMTATAEAQGGGAGRAGGGRGGVARLMTDITVSAEVQTKIDTIVAKYEVQRRELMGMPAGGAAAAGGGGGGGGGMGMQMTDEQRTKIAELTAKRNAEIRALLTAEQQVVFDKNVAAAPQGRMRGGAAAGAGAPPPTL